MGKIRFDGNANGGAKEVGRPPCHSQQRVPARHPVMHYAGEDQVAHVVDFVFTRLLEARGAAHDDVAREVTVGLLGGGDERDRSS